MFILSSCTGKMGPEEVLKKYVNYRLDGGFDKEEITNLLSDDMKVQIEKMSEAEFKQFKSLKIKSLKSLKVIKKKCQDTNCFLTYSFKYSKGLYDSKVESSKDVEVEIKKVAKLKQIEGIWKVSTIDDLKSYIRFNKPIDLVK